MAQLLKLVLCRHVPVHAHAETARVAAVVAAVALNSNLQF